MTFEIERRVTANTTVTLSDSVILADTTAGAVTATLMPANSVPQGTEFTLKKVAGGNDAILGRAGLDTINGVGANFSFLAATITSARIASDGASNWNVLASTGV